MSETLAATERVTVVEESVSTVVSDPSLVVTVNVDPLIVAIVPRVPLKPPGPPGWFGSVAALDALLADADFDPDRLRKKMTPPASTSATTPAAIHVRADGDLFGVVCDASGPGGSDAGGTGGTGGSESVMVFLLGAMIRSRCRAQDGQPVDSVIHRHSSRHRRYRSLHPGSSLRR
jgi:hypothetical protein